MLRQWGLQQLRKSCRTCFMFVLLHVLIYLWSLLKHMALLCRGLATHGCLQCKWWAGRASKCNLSCMQLRARYSSTRWPRPLYQRKDKTVNYLPIFLWISVEPLSGPSYFGRALTGGLHTTGYQLTIVCLAVIRQWTAQRRLLIFAM